MKKNLKKIKKYLDNVGIHATYNSKNNTLCFPIIKNSDGKKIYEFIENRNGLIYTYVSVGFDFFIENDLKYKLSEYLHRANYNMIRGNFEYNIDKNIIRFKYYFEKSIIERESYTTYNILIAATMFQKYFKGMLEILSTEKSAKEILANMEHSNSKI